MQISGLSLILLLEVKKNKNKIGFCFCGFFVCFLIHLYTVLDKLQLCFALNYGELLLGWKFCSSINGRISRSSSLLLLQMQESCLPSWWHNLQGISGKSCFYYVTTAFSVFVWCIELSCRAILCFHWLSQSLYDTFWCRTKLQRCIMSPLAFLVLVWNSLM